MILLRELALELHDGESIELTRAGETFLVCARQIADGRCWACTRAVTAFEVRRSIRWDALLARVTAAIADLRAGLPTCSGRPTWRAWLELGVTDPGALEKPAEFTRDPGEQYPWEVVTHADLVHRKIAPRVRLRPEDVGADGCG